MKSITEIKDLETAFNNLWDSILPTTKEVIKDHKPMHKIAFLAGVSAAGCVIFSKETIEDGLAELQRQLTAQVAARQASNVGRN